MVQTSTETQAPASAANNVGYNPATPADWPIVPREVGSALDATKAIVAANRDFFNGTFLESFNALVTSDGATVTMSIEQSGGGDLTMRFSDGRTTLDCTPAATLPGDLTAGSDASPTGNFVYIPQSTKVLTKSTSDWPSAEHIKIGYFLVPSAAFVLANGVYVNHNTNDHAQGTDSQGHLVHITERLRSQHAIYKSGVALTMTIGGGATVDAAVTAGIVYQMHKHATPALDTVSGDAILIINQNGAAYDPVTDLENLTNDSAGVAVKKYFNWVIWGVGNKGGEYSPLMLNLPTGSYNQQASAESDVSGYDVLTIPSEFNTDSQTGFLIARVTMSLIGGTWAHVSTVDLRGATPQTVVGGVGGVDTEFADNAFKLFDEGDNTKILDFQLSGITTGNTRTITMANADVDLGEMVTAAASFTSDNVVLRSDGVMGRGAQHSTVSILDTGVTSIPGLGTGGYTDYDLRVGNVTAPSYGMIQIGNMAIGRTSYKVGAIDLDGAILIRNIGGPATSQIELCVVESGGTDCRFAIAKSGVGNATYNARSVLIAGPAPADTDFVKVSYWQTQGIFDNLACDTAGSGADLGVQNDLEVEGDIFVDSILESTTAAGVTIDSVLLKDGLVDGVDVATAVTAAAASAFVDTVQVSAGADRTLKDAATTNIFGKATLGTDVNLQAKNTGGTGTLIWKRVNPRWDFSNGVEFSGNIVDATANEIIIPVGVSSAVNEVTITNAITTAFPSVAASGGDTHIDLSLIAKGTAAIRTNAPLKLAEVAAAVGDTAGFTQLWAKSTTPSQLWFTDDAGSDFQISPDIGCRVYKSTDTSIVHNTGTAISFSHERWDTDTMWVIGAPTRITFTTAGKYSVGAAVRWESNTVGYRQVGIRVNGGDQIAIDKMDTETIVSTAMQTVSTIFDFAATDYIELMVRQTSGGNIDVDSVDKFSPEMWAQLLAAT